MLPVTFERFVRPDRPGAACTGGTGLGLSIVATLARSQQASIEAGNGGDVGGAWVRLVFPGDASPAMSPSWPGPAPADPAVDPAVSPSA